jgi:hypothetical protein
MDLVMRAVIIAVVAGMLPKPAHAQQRAASASACAMHAPEAARRSGLPVDVLLRVMHVESRGDREAISPKGAIGCMQIMPVTWRYLTARYRLGDDPFEPHMNMIGGALYLAELARQFGFPGAYSAYNAGPGRYRRHVRGGIPLPSETIAYVAQITGDTVPPPRTALADHSTVPRWQEAALFMPPSRQQRSSAPPAPEGATRDHVGASHPAPANSLFPVLRPAVASD